MINQTNTKPAVRYVSAEIVERNLAPITHLQSARFWVCTTWMDVDGKCQVAGYWLNGQQFARLMKLAQAA